MPFNLSGGKQRRDIRAAQAQANQYLDQGYADSQAQYGNALARLDPYAQSGQKSQTFYEDALGLNGADARSAAQDVISSDPMWSGKFAQDSNAVLRNMNARGQGAGGAAALAGQRVLTQNYGNWLDRYANLGRQGFEATGMQSQLNANMGDNAYGYGATKAANAIGTGNALAGTRNVGMNNLMGLMGTGLNAYAKMMKPV